MKNQVHINDHHVFTNLQDFKDMSKVPLWNLHKWCLILNSIKICLMSFSIITKQHHTFWHLNLVLFQYLLHNENFMTISLYFIKYCYEKCPFSLEADYMYITNKHRVMYFTRLVRYFTQYRNSFSTFNSIAYCKPNEIYLIKFQFCKLFLKYIIKYCTLPVFKYTCWYWSFMS